MKSMLYQAPLLAQVRAGKKDRTRRVIKGASSNWILEGYSSPGYRTSVDRHGSAVPVELPGQWATFYDPYGAVEFPMFKAPYEQGETVYMPEPWRCIHAIGMEYAVEFKDGKVRRFNFTDPERAAKWAKYEKKPFKNWQSPYFMPVEAARHFATIRFITAEHLKDMTLADVLLEGIEEADSYEATWERWHSTWNGTVPKHLLPLYGVDADPWVWVIRFDYESR